MPDDCTSVKSIWNWRKTLRRFVKEHIREDYIIQIGSHIRIKRELFKKYLDENITVL
ncbi:MAG: excisionase [Coprococcus comes]|uniref:excisionase n=1 Tax=[Ruminococcus] torques TaxID=33039 RepID=UPI00399BC044